MGHFYGVWGPLGCMGPFRVMGPFRLTFSVLKGIFEVSKCTAFVVKSHRNNSLVYPTLSDVHIIQSETTDDRTSFVSFTQYYL